MKMAGMESAMHHLARSYINVSNKRTTTRNANYTLFHSLSVRFYGANVSNSIRYLCVCCFSVPLISSLRLFSHFSRCHWRYLVTSHCSRTCLQLVCVLIQLNMSQCGIKAINFITYQCPNRLSLFMTWIILKVQLHSIHVPQLDWQLIMLSTWQVRLQWNSTPNILFFSADLT